MKQYPPRQIFEKLVNKNAIKRKIGGLPWQFFLKPLTPPRNFGKNIPYPLPWIFNQCASMSTSLSVSSVKINIPANIVIYELSSIEYALRM